MEYTNIRDEFSKFYRIYPDVEHSYYQQIRSMPTRNSRSLVIQFGHLMDYSKDLAEILLVKPDMVLKAAEEELLQAYPGTAPKFLHVRIKNLPESEIVGIRNIRSEHIGRLIGVEGVLTRSSQVKPKLTKAVFRCERCGEEIIIPQDRLYMKKPAYCMNPSCGRSGPFKFLEEKSEFIDWQRIRVQEKPEELRGGQLPRFLSGVLTDDLVDVATPGNRVFMVGVIRAFQETGATTSKTTFQVQMDVNHIEVIEKGVEEIELSEEDIEKIKKMSEDPLVVDKVITSIASSVYGYQEVKEAIALQLFGGCTRVLPDGVRLRGDSNVLLVGDPGVAKCVSGETEVLLGTGGKTRIGELVENAIEERGGVAIDDGYYTPINLGVYSLDKTGLVSKTRATLGWKRRAPEKMYRVVTHSGKTLEVTPTHPFLVFSRGLAKFCQASKLFVGAPIATIVGGALSPVVRWDPVESIEVVPPGELWVYDLEVAGTHNFVANGVVVHNSQLLKYVAQLSPRGLYTSGKGSSAAGLTASVVRDDDGSFTLEAGALVIADGGLACIDEIDKMDEKDRSAIHEAMEQQTISISKAGINTTLNARTSILAAANPKGGRFDPNKNAAEQIDLPPTLLSRFDLIFVLEDRPDTKRDEQLAKHIISLRRDGSTIVSPPYDIETLRKYIVYSKRYIHPVLTPEAEEEIQRFYLEMRSLGREGNPIAITPRQLEALVRLTEARARLRLSQKATVEDARAAIMIMKKSMEQVGRDPETGRLDIDVIMTGTTKTQREKASVVREMIEKLCEDHPEGFELEELFEMARDSGIGSSFVRKIVQEMVRSGELYTPKEGKYAKVG